MIGAPSQLPRTIDLSNAEHGRYVLGKILEIAPPGSTVGVIGLAYKAGTDLIDRSYSVELVGWLLAEGRKVSVWDPQAMDHVRAVMGDRISYCPDAETCLGNAEVAVIALPLPELERVEWSAGKRTTVVDCWRTLPSKGRDAVGAYIPLGMGRDEVPDAWLRRIAGSRFDLLTN